MFPAVWGAGWAGRNETANSLAMKLLKATFRWSRRFERETTDLRPSRRNGREIPVTFRGESELNSIGPETGKGSQRNERSTQRNEINEMKYQLYLLAAAVALVARPIDAAPLPKKQIAADAKWLVHVDLQNLRKTSVFATKGILKTRSRR